MKMLVGRIVKTRSSNCSVKSSSLQLDAIRGPKLRSLLEDVQAMIKCGDGPSVMRRRRAIDCT